MIVSECVHCVQTPCILPKDANTSQNMLSWNRVWQTLITLSLNEILVYIFKKLLTDWTFIFLLYIFFIKSERVFVSLQCGSGWWTVCPSAPLWLKSPCLAVLLALCVSAALPTQHSLNLWPAAHTQHFSVLTSHRQMTHCYRHLIGHL